MKSLLILTLVALTQPPDPPPTLVVKAGSIHLGTGEVLTPGTLIIRDGRVAAAGKGLSAPEGARVLDLGDRVITPGFVDGVTYAGLPRGASHNEEGRESTPSIRSADALDADKDDLAFQRAAGVTSLVVHPGSRNVIGGLSCWVKPSGGSRDELVREDALGLRITLGSDPVSGHRGNSLRNRRPLSRMGTVFVVRKTLERARNLMVRLKAGSKEEPTADEAVLIKALRGDIPVFWQARAAKEIRTVLTLAAEFGLTRNVVLEGHQADQVAAELKAKGIPVLVGPLFHPQSRGGVRRGPRLDATQPEHADEHDDDHEADLIHPCRVGCEEDHEHVLCLDPTHVHDDTDPTCLGHDCCAVGARLPDEEHYPQFTARTLWRSGVQHGFGRGDDRCGDTLLDFARFAVRTGLPAERAIPLITHEAARILGIEARVGSLGPGKDADLVVFEGDPLAPTAAVRLVMIDGRVVFDPTGLVTQPKE